MSNQKPNGTAQIGADIVVRTLEEYKVRWAFGIPGAKIDNVFNRLVDSKIQTVVCRHEHRPAQTTPLIRSVYHPGER